MCWVCHSERWAGLLGFNFVHDHLARKIITKSVCPLASISLHHGRVVAAIKSKRSRLLWNIHRFRYQYHLCTYAVIHIIFIATYTHTQTTALEKYHEVIQYPLVLHCNYCNNNNPQYLFSNKFHHR